MAEFVHKNEVCLSGVVAGAPDYSHENHGVRFYRFPLCVRRLSGQADVLTIMAAERLLPAELAPGAAVCLEGQLRSYNHKTAERNHLILTVYARALRRAPEEHCNEILLCGTICKQPHLRGTPLGRRICDIMLAVNRPYGRADYIPCIAWGRLAEKIGAMQVGEDLAFEGRIQSRYYQKMLETGCERRVAYEVSVMRMRE